MKFSCTKTYGHNEGLSTTFRQWRAESHCRFIHGYAIKVELTFTADKLDKNGWVFDFGGLKVIKQWLHDNFDHKTQVAEDDPSHVSGIYKALHNQGLIDMIVLPRVGMEAFAEHIGEHVHDWIMALPVEASNGALITMCRVWEHEGNGATWMNFKS